MEGGKCKEEDRVDEERNNEFIESGRARRMKNANEKEMKKEMRMLMPST